MKVSLTIEQLEKLLIQQKENVIENLAHNTTSYNSENTASNVACLPIDKDKFRNLGLKSRFPNDFDVLKRYLTND